MGRPYKTRKNVARNVHFLKSLAYLSALSLNFTLPGPLGALWGWSWRLLWALGRSLGLLGGLWAALEGSPGPPGRPLGVVLEPLVGAGALSGPPWGYFGLFWAALEGSLVFAHSVTLAHADSLAHPHTRTHAH